MKHLKIVLILLLTKTNVYPQQLTIVDQNYTQAKNIALKENKLILIDFYTIWCGPCKMLDKSIFKNDSLKQKLGANFVLLKYNAEDDAVFNLSKKHHIAMYPTGIILTKNGEVLNKQYGFDGNGSYFKFTNEAIEFERENKTLKGYSNEIDLKKYPRFYINSYDRKPIDSTEFNSYWRSNKDIFSEAWFSALVYYAQQVPGSIADVLIKNKTKFNELYGPADVNTALFLMATGKFKKAISHKSKTEFDNAVDFAKRVDAPEDMESLIQGYKKGFLLALDKWDEVFKANEILKKNNQFNEEEVNSFCWEVYLKCNEKTVILKSVLWMKELTDKRQVYAYMDTYACVLAKSGDKAKAKKIAELAIQTGKKNNEDTGSTEEFLKSLNKK